MNNISNPNELLDFMSKHIIYGYLGVNGKLHYPSDNDFDSNWDSKYILESKDDVLKNGCGNCWDQVEFARDWFVMNGYEIKTLYEMVQLDYENNYPSHAFLIYKTGNNWNWFENADFNNFGIHTFNSYDELINYQYNRYLKFLKTFNIKKDEIEKIIIREFTKPKEKISAREYLNHVINSKPVILNYQNVLFNNIHKIHTTKLGNERIKKNLKIDNFDIVDYLKNKILDKKAYIYRKGKNYYCEIDNIKITINAYNYCIITAHIIKKEI